jgi:hypothetical protein
MVFARAKLTMEENCFVEEPGGVEVKFVGPGVKKLYKLMHESMKSVFNVTDSDIQETDYNWGKSDKGDKFKVRWWLHKDMDLFSYLYVRFDISGEDDNKGNGRVTITTRGLLRTEYPQDTVWQRSLLYEMLRTLWHRAFYHKKREEYAEECRHETVLFMNKMKEYCQRLGESVGKESAPAEAKK